MANVHVMSLHGEIDCSQKQWIEQELSQIERFGFGAVAILDLTDVRYLDSTFLNALIRVKKHVRREQLETSICIIAPRNNIAQLFEITNLNSVFQMFDDMASARQYVRDAVPLYGERGSRAGDA